MYNKLAYKFLLFIILAFSICGNAQEKRPNILFIAIDDMNDWTGFLGGHSQAITPNLDKIAKQGINFTNAHTTAPGCSPSRNALLYGIQPFNSGLYPFYETGIHEQLMNKYVSLPRLLNQNGYTTYGAGKIHHASKYDEREWTDYLETKPIRKRFRKGVGYIKGTKSKYSYRPTLNPDKEHIDYQVASYGIEKLQENHDSPFFLAVGIVKPHLPFDAPERYFKNLPEVVKAPEIIENDLNDLPKVGKSFIKRGEYTQYTKDKAWNDIRKAYLACISWADYNIGRVLNALEESEYAKNTVVIIWSDHGYHLGEKQTFKKFTLWEESTRVPFIIYDGRLTQLKDHIYSEPVSLINIYKTIADYTNTKIPDYIDGESLVPIIKNVSQKLQKPTITTWGRGNYSVRTKSFRYTQYFDGGEELYNHDEDPNEWYNLAHETQYESLKVELKSHLPKQEKGMISEHLSIWSIEGADKSSYHEKKNKNE